MAGVTSRQVGVNWTRGEHLPLIQQLVRSGRADYCEVLIDNFLHVPPEEMRRALGDVPVAFHIMHSRFLERDDETLRFMAARIRQLAGELKPLYLSDHLLRFSVAGREVLFLPELDYEQVYEHARKRIVFWQELLGGQVLFENYPSLIDTGLKQPAFFEALMRDTGMGVLFDFSNAVCARRNCGVEPSAWAPVLSQVEHFHAAGYEVSATAPFTALDTHGEDLAEDTLYFIRETLERASHPISLCIERDRNIELEAWGRSLEDARRVMGGDHV